MPVVQTSSASTSSEEPGLALRRAFYVFAAEHQTWAIVLKFSFRSLW